MSTVSTDDLLRKTRQILDKIIIGTPITTDDIKDLIFDKSFKLPANFCSSKEFDLIISCFNFNGDDKVDSSDFEFLKNHISDLDISLKLVRATTLIVGQAASLQNIQLGQEELIDSVIRIILYGVLYISASRSDEFIKWATTVIKRENYQTTNEDILFDILTNLIVYIKSVGSIKTMAASVIAFFKTKCGCSCLSVDDSEEKHIQATAEITSLVAQVHNNGATLRLAHNANGIIAVVAAAKNMVSAPREVKFSLPPTVINNNQDSKYDSKIDIVNESSTSNTIELTPTPATPAPVVVPVIPVVADVKPVDTK